MNRSDWEAMQEMRRWIEAAGRGGYEIDQAQGMPRGVKAERAKRQSNPSYTPNDLVLEHYMRTDPAYGGDPGNSTRLTNAIGEAVNTSGRHGASLTDKILGIIRGSHGQIANNPATSKTGPEVFSSPASGRRGAAYSMWGDNTMGSPTKLPGGDNPWSKPHFPGKGSLADAYPDAAKLIESALVGGLKTRGIGGMLIGYLVDQARKNKAFLGNRATQADIDAINAAMGYQNADNPTQEGWSGIQEADIGNTVGLSPGSISEAPYPQPGGVSVADIDPLTGKPMGGWTTY